MVVVVVPQATDASPLPPVPPLSHAEITNNVGEDTDTTAVIVGTPSASAPNDAVDHDDKNIKPSSSLGRLWSMSKLEVIWNVIMVVMAVAGGALLLSYSLEAQVVVGAVGGFAVGFSIMMLCFHPSKWYRVR